MEDTFIEKIINNSEFTKINSNSIKINKKTLSTIEFTETIEMPIVEPIKVELMAYVFDNANILASDFDALNLMAYDFDYWQPKGG